MHFFSQMLLSFIYLTEQGACIPLLRERENSKVRGKTLTLGNLLQFRLCSFLRAEADCLLKCP